MNNNIINIQEALTEKETKITLNFITALTKLTPIELMGAATMLNVSVYEKGKEKKPSLTEAKPRPVEEVIIDLLDAFNALELIQKQNMIKLLKGKLK